VAVVTGGTSNIGLAIAAHFLNCGWNVTVLSRGRQSAARLLGVAASAPGALELLQADVTEPVELERAALLVAQRFGRVGLLVNNAGGLCEKEALLETDPAWFRSVFDLNMCGTFNSCRAFGELIIKSRGKIINLSGGGATSASPDGWNLAYTSAKAAVLRFTESLANQLAPQGVEVYAVDPGWVPSPEERQKILNNEQPEELVDKTYLRAAEETPALIAYLLTNGGPDLTGRLFSVLDDYRQTISLLRRHPDSEALKLRLHRGG
jgi:NAD(P)-dependent dehydrogenase (short-subunit alcohol dehydrogenase family)